MTPWRSFEDDPPEPAHWRQRLAMDDGRNLWVGYFTVSAAGKLGFYGWSVCEHLARFRDGDRFSSWHGGWMPEGITLHPIVEWMDVPGLYTYDKDAERVRVRRTGELTLSTRVIGDIYPP